MHAAAIREEWTVAARGVQGNGVPLSRCCRHRRKAMKATVDESCVACGLCEELCPEVFQLGDADVARVIADPVPESGEDCCLQAEAECPVDAIRVQQ